MARPPALVDLLGGPHRAGRRVDDRRVPRDALPHRGTRRHDHEVRALETEQERVELVVSARHAHDLGVAPVHRLELVERRLERVGDPRERFADPALRHLEHHRFGAIQRLCDVVGRVVPHLGDVAGDADQPPEQGELVDDACVVAGVRGRGRRRLDPQQRCASADCVEQLGAAQLLGDRDRVDGFALPVQRHDRLVDVDVRGLVVVARLDVRFDGCGDRVARQQHRSQERLFGFEVVGRDAPRPLPPRVIDRLDHCAPFLPLGPPGPPIPAPRAADPQFGVPPTRCLVPHLRRVGLWIDRAISLWIRASCLHNPGDESLSFSGWGVTATRGRDEHAGRSVAGTGARRRALGNARGRAIRGRRRR